MPRLLTFVFSSLLISLSSATFSLFLPERIPQDYNQDQDSQEAYWAEPDQAQDYSDDNGFRYQQSYQSSYRHQIQQQNRPYTTPQYHNNIYQQLPPSPVPTYQFADPAPHSHSAVLPGSRVPTANVPFYQIVTIGPEVPVLVRLPNQQTAILPVRTVYSLPSFLETIVQRVQNYYSVYNPLEVLKIPRENATSAPNVDKNTTTTSGPGTPAGSSTPTTTPSANADRVATLKAVDVASSSAASTTDPTDDGTTESNTISAESTTVQ